MPFVELNPTCWSIRIQYHQASDGAHVGGTISGAGELSLSLNKPVQLVDINEVQADITDKLVN